MNKVFTLLCTMVAMLCTVATANAADLKVAVPFEFVVSGTTMPAATYIIREPLPNDNRNLAFLGQGTGVLAMASELDTEHTGDKLVFHRVGDQYFLSDVVEEDGTRHFAVSRKEAQLARSMQQAQVPVAINLGN
jgi:hypothetical protein